jgi:hypothetical protein
LGAKSLDNAMVVVISLLDTEEPVIFFFCLRLCGWAAAATTGGDCCELGNDLPSDASLAGSDLERCQADGTEFDKGRLSLEALGSVAEPVTTVTTCVVWSSMDFGRFCSMRMVGDGEVSTTVAFGRCLDEVDGCLVVGEDAAATPDADTGFPGPEMVRPPCPLPFITLDE